VYKFASCDGCQLSLLDCEDELLSILGEIEIAYFMEARTATMEGPYDVTLIEGSITTEEEIVRIKEARRQSRFLVSIGACATAGGIQSLKNWADVDEYINTVYASPSFIDTLETSRPISDYIKVDFELRGCPISKYQLVDLITSLLIGRKPNTPAHSVCMECKQKGTVCVMVSEGIACLGPVTQGGCNAICPSYNRGCYGCFGPVESGNPIALGNQLIAQGMTSLEVSRAFRGFNGYSPAFKAASEHFEES
jgi:coenzyme F420-reducing hydrogenase gamma subunit